MVESLISDIDLAITYRAMTAPTVLKGEFSSDPRAAQAVQSRTQTVQNLSSFLSTSTSNNFLGPSSPTNDGGRTLQDPISKFMTDEMQYSNEYQFVKESKLISAAIFYRKKSSKNKRDADSFQVRMSLYDIEPGQCYSIVAPNSIIKQPKWNPNCVLCKSLGDGLYKTILRFQTKGGKAVAQIQSVDQAHVLLEKDVENYTVAYSSLNVEEDVRQRQSDWQIPKAFVYYSAYVFSPIMQKKQMIGTDITLTIKAKLDAKITLNKKTIKNIVTDSLINFAESFDRAIRDYHV